jgi:hypothetical protein
LKRSRDEIQLAGSTNQPRVAKFRKGKCEGDQRHPKKQKIQDKKHEETRAQERNLGEKVGPIEG